MIHPTIRNFLATIEEVNIPVNLIITLERKD